MERQWKDNVNDDNDDDNNDSTAMTKDGLTIERHWK